MTAGTHRCSVAGCPNLAAYEVMLYDFDLAEGAVLFEPDDDCPYICVEHALANERAARGDRLPHGHTAYPFTNRGGLPGIAVYLQLEPAYVV